MPSIQFNLNGKPQNADVVPEMPLLWYLRDTLGMTGTKFGCGMALCGACTVHINGQATRSCVTPVSSLAGKNVTTIEGLSPMVFIPCRRPGLKRTFRNAGTASRVRSWLPPLCSRRRSSPAMPISMK